MVSKIIGVLRGMKAIADFVGFSPATVLKLQKNYPGMPISKVNGEWLGNLEALDQFMKDLAAGKTEKWLEPPVRGTGGQLAAKGASWEKEKAVE